MFKVNQSLIRYWDKEFPSLKLKKNRNGNRKFTKEDILELSRIYNLVKERGFTIEGARNELKQIKKIEERNEMLKSMLKQMHALKTNLLRLKESL